MRSNLVLPNDNNQPTVPDEILKTTALLYLREALDNQQFEQCPTFVQTAKRFGARPSEVRQVLVEYTNRNKAGRRNEAKERIGGRLRLI